MDAQLRFRDACKRDLGSMDIDVRRWEEMATDQDRWRMKIRRGLAVSEARRRQAARDKSARRNDSQWTALRAPTSDVECATGTATPVSACTITAGDATEQADHFSTSWAQIHDLPRSKDADDALTVRTSRIPLTSVSNLIVCF